MQIPPASSAAQAASILAQSTSKDKASGAAANAASGSQVASSQVEKSEAADPDRDAQGQGDGFDHGDRQPDKKDKLDGEQANSGPKKTGELPGEPPSQLDIVA